MVFHCCLGDHRPGELPGGSPKMTGWSGWGGWVWSSWRTPRHLPCARAGPWLRPTTRWPGTSAASGWDQEDRTEKTICKNSYGRWLWKGLVFLILPICGGKKRADWTSLYSRKIIRLNLASRPFLSRFGSKILIIKSFIVLEKTM